MNIIPIFNKGSRKACDNYQGISLLSIAVKIMTLILLNRIKDKTAPNILPETQCGFHNAISTMDMIFSQRQIQKNCIEQSMPMYGVFIYFTKGFDTVSREGLWNVLRKQGCTDKVNNLFKALHDGIQAEVLRNQGSSNSLLPMEVKLGCVCLLQRCSHYTWQQC